MTKNKVRLLTGFIAIITAIMGQVYLNPFNSDFRISLGVIVLTVLLLRFEKVSIVWACVFSGIAVFSIRVFIDYLPLGHGLSDIMGVYFPAVGFYLFYGVFLELFKIREMTSHPFVCLMILAISDSVSNIIEVLIRREMPLASVEIIIGSLLLTGVLRAGIGYLLFLSEKFYNVLLVTKEQKNQYKEFLLVRANVRSEIFFMKKSMEDIEEAMKMSFSIYKELNTKKEGVPQEELGELKHKVLNISKGIHEVKKDYVRIVDGMEKILPDFKVDKYKDSMEIFEIITEATEKHIKRVGKNIDFKIISEAEFPIFEYSALISILNNLIVNSIDAIEQKGAIVITVEEGIESVEFCITDDGDGIKDKNQAAIFTPGFSTKFDKNTGKMSTGIGLTHVKHIVEKQFEGSIEVDSAVQLGTTFTVTIPKMKLCIGGE